MQRKCARITVIKRNSTVEIREVTDTKDNIGTLVYKQKFLNNKEAYTIADMYLEEYLKQGVCANICGV